MTALDPHLERVTGLRRVLANALALLLAYILPKLLTIGAVILAARVLGVSGFGQYGTAAAFAVILSIIATLGMQPLLIREMARDPASATRWLSASHLVKAATNSVMLALLFWLAGPVLDYPPEVRNAALILGLGYAIAAWAENLAAWFQSIERMEVWMQASAAAGLVTGICGSVLVLITRRVEWFCAAFVLGQLAALLWLAARMPRDLHRGRAGYAEMRRLLHALAPFAAGFIALTLHTKIGVPMLARWWQPTEVGLYTAAHKFIDIVQAMAVAAAAAVYPRLSRSRNSRDAATRLLELILLAATLVSGALWLGREGVVTAMFGRRYDAAVPVVAMLALAIVPLAINIAGGYVLAAAGEVRRVAVLYGVATLVKIGFNALLVPDRGAIGTAMAMTVTEVALAIGMIAVLWERAVINASIRALAGGVMGAVLCAALSGLRSPFGGLPAAAAFLIATMVLMGVTGGVPRSDRALLLAALRLPRAAAGERT
jgi:O-antigen/teichoic acid export membrane protein